MTVDMVSEDLSIGQLSSMTGLSIHTLRYYEKIGLIEPVPRTSSGHRCYSRDTAVRAEALSYLRTAGMSIDGMRRYLAAVDRGQDGAAELAELLADHAARITAQIAQLEIRRDYIDAKAAYWKAVAGGRGDSATAQASLHRARDLSGGLR